MSAILTWNFSGLGSKSGTTLAAFYADFRALVNSKAADPAFKWEEASYSIAGNPHYFVLKRKDASAGRILFCTFTGSPAGNNVAVLEATPSPNVMQVAWFPNGNVDTPSNLTAASGTILGDDTDCTKFANTNSTVAACYGVNLAPYYYDSDEALWVFTGHTGSANTFLLGAAGLILVDGSDNEVGAATVGTNGSIHSAATSSSSFWTWLATEITAGASTSPHFRTNYGNPDRLYFQAYEPAGAFFTQATGGVSDPTLNPTTNTVSFLGIPLMAGFYGPIGTVIKNEGIPLKIRQFGWGPSSLGSFSTYSTTGPVVKALSPMPAVAGGNSLWFTNFKI